MNKYKCLRCFELIEYDGDKPVKLHCSCGLPVFIDPKCDLKYAVQYIPSLHEVSND
jgi:hypothetical protein